MQKTVFWIIAIVIIVAGWYFWSANSVQAPVTDINTESEAVSGQNANDDAQATSTPPIPVTVAYDGSGFAPSSVTIKKGDTVTFNSASGNMWVASAPHPAHTGYDGTPLEKHCAAGYIGEAPFDQCASGTSFTFTFGKTGTWKYHNHLNPRAYGSVTVQ